MSTCPGRPARLVMSHSACSNKCPGLSIATFAKLFFCSEFYKRKAFLTFLAQLILYSNEGIERRIAINLCFGAIFLVEDIECRQADVGD